MNFPQKWEFGLALSELKDSWGEGV
jgi:hypothetical protein